MRNSESIERSITTIGNAVLFQNVFRWIAIGVIAWLTLSYADRWIMAALS